MRIPTNKEEIILRTSTPASNETPKFIGQRCIDTTAKVAYISVGLANTDWKQISNA
jgi:hypothetical protein